MIQYQLCVLEKETSKKREIKNSKENSTRHFKEFYTNDLWLKVIANCHILHYTRARPFWVTFLTAKDRETCACIVHSNMNFIISGLKNVGSVSVKNGKEALGSVVCSLKNRKCMTGKCNICRNRQLTFHNRVQEDINIKFYQWKMLKENRIIKGNKKIVKRMMKT